MRKYLALFTIFGSFLSLALSLTLPSDVYAAELATVMGTPAALGSVTQIIDSRFRLVESSCGEEASSSWAYSILAREGVKSAVSVEVLDNCSGAGSDYHVLEGLQLATTQAPIVFSSLGPVREEACDLLSKYPETAFVVVAGNDSVLLSSEENPHCLSENILFVAAFDQYQQTLASFANWGPYIRIAGPSIKIGVTSPDGTPRLITSTTAGASLVAASLVHFAKKMPGLKGARLINEFLKTKGTHIPGLDGKVKDGLALVEGH